VAFLGREAKAESIQNLFVPIGRRREAPSDKRERGGFRGEERGGSVTWYSSFHDNYVVCGLYKESCNNRVSKKGGGERRGVKGYVTPQPHPEEFIGPRRTRRQNQELGSTTSKKEGKGI